MHLRSISKKLVYFCLFDQLTDPIFLFYYTTQTVLTARKMPEYDPVFYRIGTDYFHI